MQKRYTLWGKTDPDEDILVSIEMDDTDYKVKLHVFPKKQLDLAGINSITEDWVKERAELPADLAREVIDRDLSEDSILPDHIRADVPGLVRSIQNEWAYALLTNKLWQAFNTELEQIKEEATGLLSYDRNLFNKAKGFWERVLEHKKERNINQSKLDEIKEELNKVFDRLKELRIEDSKKYEGESEGNKNQMMELFGQLKAEIEKGDTSKEMFAKLKDSRMNVLKGRFVKEHKEHLNKELDILFALIKTSRNKVFSGRLDKRITDLQQVAQKMEKSIAYDKKEYDFQTRRLDKGNTSQLEMQLRKAKMNMLQDKIKSKEDKLRGIRSTLDDLLKKAGKLDKEKEKIEEVVEKVSKPKAKADKKEAAPAKEERPEKKPEAKADKAAEPAKEETAKAEEATVEASEKAAEPEAKPEVAAAEKPTEATADSTEIAPEAEAQKAAEPEAKPEVAAAEEPTKAAAETESPAAEEKPASDDKAAKA